MRRSVVLAAMTTAIFVSATTAAGAVSSSANYYGGPIMSSANMVMVVWDTTNQAAAYLDHVSAMLTDAAADSGKPNTYFGVLTEYRTIGLNGFGDTLPGSGQYLDSRQRFLGRFDIKPGNTSKTLDNAAIAAELNAQMAAGHIPAATTNVSTAYLVLFPGSGYTLHGQDASSMAGLQYCDIHSTGTYAGNKYAFSQIPDWTAGTAGYGGCGGNVSYIDNQTMNISHQIAEMITDPLVGEATTFERPVAWYRPSGGEIGDICNGQTATAVMNGHSYLVQKLWLNSVNACVAGAAIYAAPVASFTATPSAGHATFDASGSTSPNTDHNFHEYDWTFGDGSTGSGVAPAHDYANAATYHVTLTTWDDAGFSATTSQEVVVPAPSPASPSVVPAGTAPPQPAGAPPQPVGGGTPSPPASVPPPAAEPAAQCTVPQLKGRTLRKAKTLLAKSHCKLGKVKGSAHAKKSGKVVKQKPKAGTRLKSGSKIPVTVA